MGGPLAWQAVGMYLLQPPDNRPMLLVHRSRSLVSHLISYWGIIRISVPSTYLFGGTIPNLSLLGLRPCPNLVFSDSTESEVLECCSASPCTATAMLSPSIAFPLLVTSALSLSTARLWLCYPVYQFLYYSRGASNKVDITRFRLRNTTIR